MLVVIVAFAAWYGYNHPELFTALGNVSAFALIAMIALTILARVFQSMQFNAFCQAFEVRLKFFEAFGLVVAGTMYSFLIPGRAGIGVQAAYLKSKYDLPLSHFGSLVAATNILMLCLSCATGLIACVSAPVVGLSMPKPLVIAFAFLLGLCVAGSVVLVIAVRAGARLPFRFLRSIFNRVDEGFRGLAQRKGLMVRILFFRVAHLITGPLILLLACRSVGLEANFIQTVSMAMLAGVGMLLPLTPGGLGISEGAMGAAGHVWGLEADAVMLAALVWRAVGLCSTFAIGVPAGHYLLGGLSKTTDTISGVSESDSEDGMRFNAEDKRANVRDVLITSVSGLGNALLFEPALRHLEWRYPDADFDILVEGAPSRMVANRLPQVRTAYDLGYGSSRWGALKTALSARNRNYDINITAFPSNNIRFNLLSFLIGAEESWAHAYPESGGLTLEWSQNDHVSAQQGLHDIEQNLRLVGWSRSDEQSPLPRPRLPLRPDEQEFADRYFAENNIRGQTIGVHPGSAREGGQLAKRWPVEQFVGLIEALASKKCNVLVFCGPDEDDLRQHLWQTARDRNWDGAHFPDASIMETAGLIAKCDVMVTNDSGLMHVATAVYTPVVALFGPTNPTRTGPVWEDCRILEVNDENRLDYPFGTTDSRLSSVAPNYWQEIQPNKVLQAIADLNICVN